jgi:hypothetical protein
MGEQVFKFKKWWLKIEGFADLVKKVWSTHCFEDDTIEV